MRSLTGVGGLEKNHEERSGIIYALHDATGGGDTKNLVIRTHTRTRAPKIRQHSSPRAPKSPPYPSMQPNKLPIWKKRKRPDILRLQADTVRHNSGCSTSEREVTDTKIH